MGATTVEDVLNSVRKEVNARDNATPCLIVASRSNDSDVESKWECNLEVKTREESRSCLGAIAANYVAVGVQADLLVVQSRAVEEI